MIERETGQRYAEQCVPTAPIPIKENVPEILRISQRVEEFVNDNGWSWCLMDRVYRVLKAAHQ